MPRSDDLRRQLIAGAIVAALSLAVIYGGRVYDWLIDAGHGFAMEPVERIHEDLLPNWALSVSGTRGTKPEPEAFERLIAAIEESHAEGLADVARKLRGEMRRGRSGSELTELLTAWNDALDEQDIPFVIRGGSLSGPSGLQYFITTARTRHDLRVQVGERDVRMRVVERVDTTNVRESVLGENTEVVGGGLLLSDRMLEFAIERVWPVLDDGARMPGWALAFADDVRKEVERDLPTEAFALLSKTAAARMKAVEATLAVRSRSECSRFRLARLPWDGLEARDLDTVKENVEHGECPAQFAWTDQPATSAYQACLASGARGGSHRGAITFLFEQLDADCVLGVPDAEQMQAFERRAFDREAPISLPEAWPETVVLPPRAE